MNRSTALALAGYIGSIVGANWAIAQFGVVAPLGIAAPAGVFFAGLALSLRDALHEAGGRRWVLAGILAGAALSAWLSGPLALASGAAFLVSEAADLAVYEPLRRRSWAAALALSNTVGAVVDSALFLLLAFGSLDFLGGQVFWKVAMVLPSLLAGATLRRWAAGRAEVAHG